MRWSLLWFLACRSAPVELPGGTDTEDSGVHFEPLTCEGGVCVAPDRAGVAIGFHRVVVDDAGVAWVSWVETSDLRPTATRVAASSAPGAPLTDPVEVPTTEAPMVGGTEKPSLDVLDGRIAIAHTGLGGLRHGDASAVYVITGTISGTRISFDDPVLIDESNAEGRVTEHALLVLGDGGDDWLLYKRQIYGSRDVPTLARALDDFTPSEVSSELSRSHECSPPALLRGPHDERALALRSNVEGTLHTMALVQQGPAFGAPVQVSRTGWPYSPLVCPPDGPRIAILPDGTLVTVWVGPSDDTLTAWLSWSTDGGASWAEPVADHETVGRSEVWPTITARADGSMVTTVGVQGGDTWRFERRTLGAPAEAHVIQGAGGQALTNVEVAHGGGRTVALGQGREGRLWLVELP